jgi:hypothetical protein
VGFFHLPPNAEEDRGSILPLAGDASKKQISDCAPTRLVIQMIPMKRSLILLFALFATFVLKGSEIDVARMAEMLSLKEVGIYWNGLPGPAGELSEFQLTEPTWRQHMAPLPFSQARDPALARLCAVRHLRWLVQQIEHRGLAATPQRVATCWHYGLGHAGRSSQWGLEVANLYHDLP